MEVKSTLFSISEDKKEPQSPAQALRSTLMQDDVVVHSCAFQLCGDRSPEAPPLLTRLAGQLVPLTGQINL